MQLIQKSSHCLIPLLTADLQFVIRFASLGSGSKGNATLIESGVKDSDTRILLDCGFSTKEVELRLAKHQRKANSIDAIVITHEHSDHITGVGRLARKYNIPVWLTAGTWHKCRDSAFPETHFIDSHNSFEINDLHLHPFPVPHDAREPCQFVFSDGVYQLGIATDLGSITPHVVSSLNNVDALLLECNYDSDMLLNGVYPPKLKQRVSGDKGHLDNRQATHLLKSIKLDKLKHVIGMHVSEKNNTQEFAENALCIGMDCESNEVSIACQIEGFGWRELS
ncbi:MAG: phosphoribosyl 1,2-cyclic phosphodiesterase [Cocleimonas sp.]|jgi:phosphoribosyl 1,2-cyclic phosphodiesterase